MGNSNGIITAPISLHSDVYPVLGIAPSGAYYDVAEACRSGKIKAGQKCKPTQAGASSSVREFSSFSLAPNESKTVYLLVENFFSNTLGGLSETLETLHWNSARIVWTRYKGSSLPSEGEYPDADDTLTWASGAVSDDLFDMGTYIET